MKKSFEYAVYTSNIISWLSLLFVFAIDDKKIDVSFEELIMLIAGVILFWAITQLIAAWYFSTKKACSVQEQADIDECRTLRAKRCEDFKEVYHQALFFQDDYSFLENEENRSAECGKNN